MVACCYRNINEFLTKMGSRLDVTHCGSVVLPTSTLKSLRKILCLHNNSVNTTGIEHLCIINDTYLNVCNFNSIVMFTLDYSQVTHF